MPRRVKLPGADELFGGEQPTATPQTGPVEPARPASGGASGRVRHDEKITVYVSSAELLEMEKTRVWLRELGINVVREAVGVMVADLAANGEQSPYVARLRQ